MLLKKIIIKNYKGIENELEIDFTISNKAKENLNDNYMFGKEDKDLIPIIVGIIGKNASGKSSILDSLTDVIEFVFQPNNIFTNFYFKQIVNDSKMQLGPLPLEKQTFETEIKKDINIKINKFASYDFENQKKMFPNEYQKFLKWIFMNYSNDQQNSVLVKLIFKDKQDDYKIGFELTSDKLIPYWLKNNEKIARNINNNSCLISMTKIDFNRDLIHTNIYLQNQWNLLKKIGIKNYNNLLRMIDDNINEIIQIKNNVGKITYQTIKMVNGSSIPYSFLSMGAQKILHFIYILVNQNINSKLNLLISDEINNFVHAKIIDFIFNLISQKNNNQQLIFSTHSPSIINLIDRHAAFCIHKGETLKVEKVASLIREGNNLFKKYINEEISSHPSSSEINEILYNWDNNK